VKFFLRRFSSFLLRNNQSRELLSTIKVCVFVREVILCKRGVSDDGGGGAQQQAVATAVKMAV
jgi:hypothetical protein